MLLVVGVRPVDPTWSLVVDVAARPTRIFFSRKGQFSTVEITCSGPEADHVADLDRGDGTGLMGDRADLAPILDGGTFAAEQSE
ncbi:hypothetical protein [uncultured Jatrophihabitans sp.]|uniref:hypothetical protein n=1 Tax=uncultured Jatrophihabitans sp. TaxID=1610747 RepID=UPI0035C975F2